MQIKSIFDADNIYDMLAVDGIDYRLIELMGWIFGRHSIFKNDGYYIAPILLIERNSPTYGNWAVDWSYKFYLFLKSLSVTGLGLDRDINGRNYGFDTSYRLGGLNAQPVDDLPYYLLTQENAAFLNTYFTSFVRFRVPPGRFVISWLERQHSVPRGSFASNLSNQISAYSKRFKIVDNNKNSFIDITLSTKDWLHNSLCCDGLEPELTENQKKFYFYSGMDAYLDEVWGFTGLLETPKILVGMSAKFLTVERPGGQDFWFEEYTSPIYQDLPEDIYFATLIKEDEVWGKELTLVKQSENYYSIAINPATGYENYYPNGVSNLILDLPDGVPEFSSYGNIVDSGYTLLDYPDQINSLGFSSNGIARIFYSFDTLYAIGGLLKLYADSNLEDVSTWLRTFYYYQIKLALIVNRTYYQGNPPFNNTIQYYNTSEASLLGTESYNFGLLQPGESAPIDTITPPGFTLEIPLRRWLI